MALNAGQYGLPSKFEPQTQCENCLAELTDKNRPKYCAACGESGCQKCLKEQDNGYQYTCPSLECMNEYRNKFAKVVDMFRASLARFILNCGEKNDD